MTQNGRPSKSDKDPPPPEGAPDEIHGVPDATLGGYLAHHDRPPAFEGSDAQPYTVSMEVEKTADLAAPFHGYLIFPRWAETGLGIVGHLETPTLVEARSRREAVSELEELSLDEVKHLLDEAIAARSEGEADRDTDRARPASSADAPPSPETSNDDEP